MIRVLAMIAVAGAIVSAVTLSIAVAIVGPAAIANGAWSWGPNGWGDHGHWRHGGHFGWSHTDDGPQTTREIAWTGGDSLTVDVDADVHYTQAEGAPKLTVAGPKGAVDDITVENGRIRYADERDHDAHLTITLAAPAVNSFTMKGSGALDIAGYKQDRLAVSVEGNADVKAAGEAKSAQLGISGSGHADLGALKTPSAKVEIDGSGDATVNPNDEAEVNISGSGDVDLLTDPPRLHTSISGSGHVHHGGKTETRKDEDE